MKNTCYKLPLDIGRLFSERGGDLERCTELESIDQCLALLLTTHQGEHGFNRQFGSRLWEMDFENIVSYPLWEKRFIDYIREAIEENETRIRDVQIQIDVKDVLHEEASMAGFSVRKRVDIITQCIVVSTGQPAAFKHTVYLGPLSMD